MIHEERIRALNDVGILDGDYVLYWMQSSVRAEFNHALEYAVGYANRLGRPLIAFFGLTDAYPEANMRHYNFLIEGLRDVRSSLEDRGIELMVRLASPESGVIDYGKRASLVIVDGGYTKIQKSWRRYAAGRLKCPLIQLESDLIVPVETASPKEEYSAATFRPKIRRNLDRFMTPLGESELAHPSLGMVVDSEDLRYIDRVLSRLDIDREVGKVDSFRGGAVEAHRLLGDFIERKLGDYTELRNDPTEDVQSGLSPYLHFGHISPLGIALEIREADSHGSEAFLEELIVRRELSFNFVHYNYNYDSFECLPDWCKETLKKHAPDRREHLYSLRELEESETHDPYWNAAQSEMVKRGKMHRYMRMYWGKKILEWGASPEEAFKTALYLNNKYELDGRDPNSYAGVAWCFGKHDRPWKERPIFGKVRYMNDRRLRRKFDADGYVRMVEGL